jgi:hypothetical protein
VAAAPDMVPAGDLRAFPSSFFLSSNKKSRILELESPVPGPKKSLTRGDQRGVIENVSEMILGKREKKTNEI